MPSHFALRLDSRLVFAAIWRTILLSMWFRCCLLCQKRHAIHTKKNTFTPKVINGSFQAELMKYKEELLYLSIRPLQFDCASWTCLTTGHRKSAQILYFFEFSMRNQVAIELVTISITNKIPFWLQFHLIIGVQWNLTATMVCHLSVRLFRFLSACITHEPFISIQ